MSSTFKFLVIFSTVALAGAVAALAQGPSGEGGLQLRLYGLRNSQGKVHCTLFNSDAFPRDDSRAVKEVDAPIKDESATCVFKAIQPGRYAIVAYHDENGNGKFDEDALGLPEEGYAFSNNVRPTLSAPSFDECAFEYHGGEQWFSAAMNY